MKSKKKVVTDEKLEEIEDNELEDAELSLESEDEIVLDILGHPLFLSKKSLRRHRGVDKDVVNLVVPFIRKVLHEQV